MSVMNVFVVLAVLSIVYNAFGIAKDVRYICKRMDALIDAVSEEGFGGSETVMETGTPSWAARLWDRIRLRKSYPEGRIPKF